MMIDRLLGESMPARMARVTIAGLTLAMASPALAQSGEVSQRIDSRVRPEYAAQPVHIGSFEAYPRVEVEGEYVDNLFGTQTNKVDDVIVSVVPSIELRDRRTDRSLNLKLLGGVETYTQSDIDERFRGEARFNGRFGLGTTTRPFLGASIVHNTGGGQDYEDFRTIAQPLDLTTMRGNAGIEQEFGPLTATVEGQYRRTDYSGSFILEGSSFDADFRDFDTYSVRGRIAYGRNPAQGIYVEGSYNKRDYSTTGTDPSLPAQLQADRSSDGYSVRAGYTRQITDLLQLDVSAGYLKQDYDSTDFSSVDGISFAANVFWAPTPLTTLQLGASRSIDGSSNPLFSGLLRTDFDIAVQHELLRNLVLSAQGRYSILEYDGVGSNDNEFSVTGSARYYVSPRWSLRFRLEHFERTGTYELTQNRVLLGIGFDF